MTQSGPQLLNARFSCWPPLSERRRKTEVIFWPPYVLCASRSWNRYPSLFVIGHPSESCEESRVSRERPINVVWNALCMSALGWAWIERKERKKRRDVSSDEVRAWVLSTRRLAQDWPYGNDCKERLSVLTDEIERAFLPMRRLVAPGPRNVQEDRRLRTTMHFWALDHFRRGMHALIGYRKRFGHLPSLESILSEVTRYSARHPERGCDVAIAPHAIEMRIRRVAERFRPDFPVERVMGLMLAVALRELEAEDHKIMQDPFFLVGDSRAARIVR